MSTQSQRRDNRFVLVETMERIRGRLKALSRPWRRGCLGLLAASSVGCASAYVTIAPEAPRAFERLGQAKASACGSLLIFTPDYNFIPVMLNSRVERAYQRAVNSVPRATSLVDVSVSESWFWWVLGSTKCTRISGEAVR